MSEDVRFYGTNRPYGWLSNFSAHPVDLGGKVWPTVEHYFQAMKFKDPERQEEVRLAPSPAKAKRLGRRPGIRSNWNEERIQAMTRAVYAKFEQHPDLAEKLVNTGDAVLIEDSPTDSYWGCGADGRGKNMLGIILMGARLKLMTFGPGKRRLTLA